MLVLAHLTSVFHRRRAARATCQTPPVLFRDCENLPTCRSTVRGARVYFLPPHQPDYAKHRSVRRVRCHRRVVGRSSGGRRAPSASGDRETICADVSLWLESLALLLNRLAHMAVGVDRLQVVRVLGSLLRPAERLGASATDDVIDLSSQRRSAVSLAVRALAQVIVASEDVSAESAPARVVAALRTRLSRPVRPTH